MSKVTSGLQITIPRDLAERYGIAPGDEVEFVPAGDAIRLVPAPAPERSPDARERLRLFDEATERQRQREQERPRPVASTASDRGWTREELYEERVGRWLR